MNQRNGESVGGNIVVVDDDGMFRESLVQNLSDAGFAPTAFADGPAALQHLVEAGAPDLILLDWKMPGMSGIEVLRHLRELKADMPVVFLTVLSDQIYEEAGLLGGAVDFIEKPFADETVLSAIKTALRRQQDKEPLQPDSELASRLQSLTDRERDVLRGLLAGHPNKTIAYDLGLSPRTVEVHRANLMTKTGASSLSELIRMALLAGYS